MTDALERLITPAVVVALLSVIIQGIKAGVDLISQVRARRISVRQAQITYVTALFALVDGIPLENAQCAVLKMKLARQLLPGELPEMLREVISE